MPDYPIIDTHLHVWDPARLRYPWLAGVPLLNRPYLLDEYDRHVNGIRVGQMVFLQCEVKPDQYRQEAAWATSLAHEDRRLTALVPWAPLEKGAAVRDELAELVSANPLTRGIRRIIQFEPDPGFCLRPDFVLGVRLLADLDLHFEICIKGDDQFRNTIELANRCPDTRFILDHIGKPFIQQQVREPWSGLIARLADLPNVWCKMSGLVTEADHKRWSEKDLYPYIARVLDVFGINRVMYGGDWPVAYQASEYPRWVQALDRAATDLGLTAADVRKLYRDNAITFYRLPARDPLDEQESRP